jgi:hypothetical protein
MDAVYLHVALANHAIVVSIEKEFIDKLRGKRPPKNAYTVQNFPTNVSLAKP